MTTSNVLGDEAVVLFEPKSYDAGMDLMQLSDASATFQKC